MICTFLNVCVSFFVSRITGRIFSIQRKEGPVVQPEPADGVMMRDFPASDTRTSTPNRRSFPSRKPRIFI